MPLVTSRTRNQRVTGEPLLRTVNVQTHANQHGLLSKAHKLRAEKAAKMRVHLHVYCVRG